MAFVDGCAVTEELCDDPRNYKWNSIHYHTARRNRDGWLKLDFAANKGQFKKLNTWKKRLRFYKKFLVTFLHENTPQKVPERGQRWKKMVRHQLPFQFSPYVHPLTRLFADTVILGSLDFVQEIHSLFKDQLAEKRKRTFREVLGNSEIYSMRHLRKELGEG